MLYEVITLQIIDDDVDKSRLFHIEFRFILLILQI